MEVQQRRTVSQMMDAAEIEKTRRELAREVQNAIDSHKVNHENIGETVRHLCQIVGGITGVIFAAHMHAAEMTALSEDIQYGIEMGVPS